MKTLIAIYPGRFQPFGMQHKVVYDWAAKKFGADKTFIATSDKSDNIKSPFNFKEKKSIISLFNLSDKVVQVKNTYNAEEILKQFDPETTAVVYIVGEKDGNRLSAGKYFLPYSASNKNLESYTKHGYYILGPKNKEVIPGYGEMNGTSVRKVLGDKTIPLNKKYELFKSIFGTFSKKIADFIINKISSLQESKSNNKILEIYKMKNSVHSRSNTQSKLFSKEWWADSLLEDLQNVLEVDLPINKWEDFDLKSLSDEDLKTIWNMYTSSYAAQGLEFSADDYKELQQKYKAVYLKDIDSDTIADAFIVYKETPFGNRISLLGTNNKPAAKSDVVKQIIKLVNTTGWFIEASKKMEDIMKSSNAPVIYNKDVILAIAGNKDVKLLDDGYYERKLSKSPIRIVKRLYGKPKGNIREGYMSTKLQSKHNNKIDKLKSFLHNNVGREFVYDFNQFPKTIYGVSVKDLQELKVLSEGGAGGHVLHPFDLPTTKTGTDLIKVFEDVAKSLSTVPARVKVDGVNTTIKLVKRNGKLQFALDRGSKKEEDLQGVTIKELGNRFPEGHGMLKIGKLVLSAFNDALPKISGELKSLGLDDPNILLNLETVFVNEAGKANVIGYDKNFFAIHGLMKSEFIDGKRSIKEIPANAATIEKIAEKASPIMNKYGFELYGFKKLQPRIKTNINFSGALNSKFTVKYNDDKSETKPLKAWLSKAVNPVQEKVTLNTGKQEPVMTKKYFLDVLNQTVNLDDMTTDPKEQKKIIDAAVMYQATVLLGDIILKALTSDVGDVENHEGIMIRDNKISKEPFKITGHFIIQGMQSGFRK